MLWWKWYGEVCQDHQTNDNHFLVAGSSTNVSGDVTSNAGQEDVWLIKIDGFGNLVWQKSYGGSQKMSRFPSQLQQIMGL